MKELNKITMILKKTFNSRTFVSSRHQVFVLTGTWGFDGAEFSTDSALCVKGNHLKSFEITTAVSVFQWKCKPITL
jgi:hypothetical protein